MFGKCQGDKKYLVGLYQFKDFLQHQGCKGAQINFSEKNSQLAQTALSNFD